MKNDQLVVLADLHANVWLRQNPSPDFRMNQLLTLADRVSQEMIRRETEHLAIAGDLIDSWNVEPKVIKTLFGFFSRIIVAIPTVRIYFIVGQHDLLKYDDYSTANSYIYEALDIFPKNVFYMHGKSITLNNTSIYFSNFSRNPDDTKLNYPPTPHDVWISHVTLGFGHEVDSPNYALGVFGDIHDYYDSGKNHSVMTPFQHYPHQPRDGKIGIIELDGPRSRFYRINSDDPEHGFEFLKLQMSAAPEKTDTALPEISVEKFDASNVNRLIEEEVTKHGLAAVHGEVKKAALPLPVDFNFQLRKLVIDNFRSVDHMELDFGKLGAITYIQGDNGSGKSTIFNAITTAFVGDKKLLEQKNNLAGKKDEVRIQLWLEYEGREFYLDRWGKNNLRFKAGEELIELGKRQQQKELEKYLPFLSYFKFFYLRPNAHYWEGLDKEEFMKVLFNLNIFDSLQAESARIAKEKARAAKQDRLRIAELDGKISSYETTIGSYRKELEEIGDVLDLDWLERMAREENSLYVATKQAYERHQAALKSLEAPAPVPPPDSRETLEKAIASTEAVLKSAEANNREYHTRKARISALESQVSRMEKNTVTCPNCGHVVSGSRKEDIDAVRNEIAGLKEDLASRSLAATADLAGRISLLKVQTSAWDRYDKDAADRARLEASARDLEEKYATAKSALAAKLGEIGGFRKHAEGAEFLSAEQSRSVRQRSVLQHLRQAEDGKAVFLPERERLRSEAEALEKEVSEYLRYSNLFDVSTVNSVPNAILNRLVSHLNTDFIQFESMKTDEDDEKRFEINVSINVDGKWISYDHASTGQRILMDQFILIRVTSFLGGSGLIMMDEPYTNLDMEKLEEAVRLLKEINSSKILITSHTSLFSNYDSVIRVRRVNGITRVEAR